MKSNLLEIIVACGLALPIAVSAAQMPVRQDSITDIPIRVMAGKAPLQKRFALFITGDGGWASIDETIVGRLAEKGISTVGVDSRAYLRQKRTPQQVADDMARLLRHYATEFGEQHFMIVGYSHGADLAPFIVARMPQDLRANLDLIGMVGLGTRAGFEFHFVDIFRDVKRPGDLPTVPELETLRAVSMICFYGADEDDSGCRDAPADLLKRVELPGGHHFDGAYVRIADQILSSLPQPPS